MLGIMDTDTVTLSYVHVTLINSQIHAYVRKYVSSHVLMSNIQRIVVSNTPRHNT